MRKVLYLMGILNDSDIQWLADNGRKSVFAPGGVLIRQGSTVEYLYIVLDGRLSVELANGVKVTTLMAGEVIGEISFVDSRPPLASVVAQIPTTVLGIEKSALRMKLESDGHFGARFYRAVALFLADRLRSTTALLGYGEPGSRNEQEESNADELGVDLMQSVSLANVRFDFLIRSAK